MGRAFRWPSAAFCVAFLSLLGACPAWGALHTYKKDYFYVVVRWWLIK